MKWKRVLVSLAVVAALGTFFTAPVSLKAAPAPTKVLKIGCTLPLQVREALEIQRWLKLFAKLINEEGGWKIGGDTYKVEYIFYNDEYNSEKARAAVERLIFKDHVKHIIGQWGGLR